MCWMGQILCDGGGSSPAPSDVNVLQGREAAVVLHHTPIKGM